MRLQPRRARLPNGIELPYVEAGAPGGSPVVLLHAYADSWRSFEAMLPLLPEWTRVVAPSQRGHGDASKPLTGYLVADFTEDLALLLDSLELEHAALVASSSAGFTAQLLALEWPERVDALVLIGTPWSLREPAASLELPGVVAALRDPVDPEFVREFVSSTSSDRVPAAFLEAMVAESAKVPAHVWRAALDGLLAAVPPEPGAIQAPTLVVRGDRDEIVSRGDQELLCAALPESRLVVYEGAGHIVHWEQPARVARDVSSFVAGLRS